MRLAKLLGPDLKDILAHDPNALREALEEFHPEDIAEILGDLPDDEAVALIRALPNEFGAEVLGRLTPEQQDMVLTQLNADEAVALLGEMSADDRVDVLQELPEEEAQELLAKLQEAEPELAEEVRELTAWGEDTAGGLMTTEYVALPPDTKVWQAIEEVRRLSQEGKAETIYSIYVTGYGGKLLGVVSLRELILSDPSKSLEDVMTTNVMRVAPSDDQEKVANAIARYDLSAIPVVDENGRLLGLVTVDDVVDVVIEEATEDAQLMGGVVPLQDSYFATTLREFVWKRATWLIVLFLAQMLTATVLKSNEQAVAATLDLMLFIPLIISSGGNSGSQSSSLIIRALAVGEVRPRDWWRVLSREVLIGLALGLILGVIGFGRAFLLGDVMQPRHIALIISLSIVAVVTVGTLLGSLLPLIIKRAGLDPAVSSTPFIASVSDVLGLLVYFGIARLLINFTL